MDITLFNFGFCDMSTGLMWSANDEEFQVAMDIVTKGLERLIYKAKKRHLNCDKVQLPAELFPNIAKEILQKSCMEPCGIRGCILFLDFKAGEDTQYLGSVKFDPTIVSTFEIYITLLQQSRSIWYSILPHFITQFTKGGKVVLSAQYTLEKKKLYRTFTLEE